MKAYVVSAARLCAFCAAVTLAAGCANAPNILGFGTATKFGLDISQRADQTIDVTMGYDRAEIASIPAPKKGDATDQDDAYSVLGTFKVSYDGIGGEPLEIDQVFATGFAAREAAKNDSVLQRFFGREAGAIANKAALAARKTGKTAEKAKRSDDD